MNVQIVLRMGSIDFNAGTFEKLNDEQSRYLKLEAYLTTFELGKLMFEAVDAFGPCQDGLF